MRATEARTSEGRGTPSRGRVEGGCVPETGAVGSEIFERLYWPSLAVASLPDLPNQVRTFVCSRSTVHSLLTPSPLSTSSPARSIPSPLSLVLRPHLAMPTHFNVSPHLWFLRPFLVPRLAASRALPSPSLNSTHAANCSKYALPPLPKRSYLHSHPQLSHSAVALLSPTSSRSHRLTAALYQRRTHLSTPLFAWP